MPMNSFASQKEVLFIMYDDIIKTTKFLILKKLMEEPYKSCYKDYIDFNKIENLSDEKLMKLIFSATDKNILKALSINKFDFDNTYIDLYLNYPDIIKMSEPLAFADSIDILLKQKFVEKVYIYTPYYDKNIYDDIYDTYGDSRIIYVYGELNDVLDKLLKSTRITSYILNDVDIVNLLIKKGIIPYTNILIVDTGWQYTINEKGIPVLKLKDSDKISKDFIFKLAMFSPYNTK